MLSPGLAKADIDISKAQEHPDTIITSSALMSLPKMEKSRGVHIIY